MCLLQYLKVSDMGEIYHGYLNIHMSEGEEKAMFSMCNVCMCLAPYLFIYLLYYMSIWIQKCFKLNETVQLNVAYNCQLKIFKFLDFLEL